MISKSTPGVWPHASSLTTYLALSKNLQLSPCLATSLVYFYQSSVKLKLNCSPAYSLIPTRHFATWMSETNLQRRFTTEVKFSCACVRPPVLFDAFMFHPSGMDTRPGADGLTN